MTTITGLNKLQAAFGQLDDVAKVSNLETATAAGSKVIVNAAREKAHVISGTLQRSINAQVEATTADRVEVRIGTNVGYGS